MKIKLSKAQWEMIGKKANWSGNEKPVSIVSPGPELEKEAKWGKEDVVDPKKKGMWDGYSQEELRGKLDAAKARQEKRDKADPKDSTLIKQLQFALRAKHNWVGSVK